MISRYEGKLPGGIVGCQIETLIECYGSVNGAAELYKNDRGAVLCRFGQTLMVCGETDSDELFGFADMTGASTIETQDLGGECPVGWKIKKYPVLYLNCDGDCEIPFLQSLKRCYDTVCSADSEFSNKSEYLYWLSDITRRQNRGYAKAYYRNAAAAVISAASETEAYLSLVSVEPEKRKEGRASQLISEIISDGFLYKKRLFTAAQHEELIPFYQKSGFLRLDKSLIIFEREHI